VNDEAANWTGSLAGPVPIFLNCISPFAGEASYASDEPWCINLGLRELAILGSWLTRASNLSSDELEDLYLDLIGFEDRR
jgi:hypothetical protein